VGRHCTHKAKKELEQLGGKATKLGKGRGRGKSPSTEGNRCSRVQEFALRGSVMDMHVGGIIIGAAFGAIVKSLL